MRERPVEIGVQRLVNFAEELVDPWERRRMGAGISQFWVWFHILVSVRM
jgi:hypothetical protein